MIPPTMLCEFDLNLILGTMMTHIAGRLSVLLTDSKGKIAVTRHELAQRMDKPRFSEGERRLQPRGQANPIKTNPMLQIDLRV